MIKSFFDDAAMDDHSAKLYGHVTHTQFKQCLSVKVSLQCAVGLQQSLMLTCFLRPKVQQH